MDRTWISDTPNRVGKTIRLNGWVKTLRKMGDKLVFMDLRDGSGVVQVVCYKPDLAEEVIEEVEKLKPESAIELEGIVNERGEKQVNKDMPTGTVEIGVVSLTVLNAAETPPFEVDKDTKDVNEELRLKHRYLDLRSDRMQKNIRMRNAIFAHIRAFLQEKKFIDIETPILTKGTPEGSREFIVPSRLHGGKFYVLPQSPQQFKQLLMVAGMERYFQIARCFRDEDQRGDRQPEFTQLDLEMSFVEQEDIIALMEEMMIELVRAVRPDAKVKETPFPRMTYAEAMEKYGTDAPDLRENKEDPNEFAFCWVTEFPMFEHSETEGKTVAVHHPFTAPMKEDVSLLESEPMKARAAAHDIVLNGSEIGGGSIRIHDRDLQNKVFELLGLSADEIKARFGHILEAFTYGAPPHGGIALGLDRIVSLFAGEPNIREVMAFPKTGDARDPLMGSPSDLPEEALKEAHIKKA